MPSTPGFSIMESQKMKANTAVMRKLFHAIYGIFKTNTPFDPNKCFAYPKTAEKA